MFSDHLGSIRDVLDSAGNLRIHRDFDSFGNVVDETHYNASGVEVTEGQAAYVDESFGYTGRWFDDETGLQYNLFRWYDPTVGRWLSEDPIGFAAGDANLARYVGNMPTTYVDSSGLAPAQGGLQGIDGDDKEGWLERREKLRQAERGWRDWFWALILGKPLDKSYAVPGEAQAGDFPRRGGKNTFEALSEGGHEGAELLKKAAEEAAIETATAGMGGWINKVDDVNDLRKASQLHHLATNKGKWGKKFAELFRRAGVNLDDAMNKMPLPGHTGRHTEAYHRFVYQRLRTAIGNRQGAAARNALESALQQLRRDLERTPRLPYRDGGL